MAERMDLPERPVSSESSVEFRDKDKIAFFLDHLLAYVVGSKDEVPNTVLQQSDFTENIGKVVQLYMSQLSKTYHSDEFWLLVFLGEDTRVDLCVTQIKKKKIRFVPHHCFFFLAAVCEMLRLIIVLEDWDNEETVKEAAVRGMAMFLPWCDNRIFEQLDASARELLAQENINLMLKDL